MSNLAEEKQKSRVYSLPSREQWTFSALAGDSEDETSVTPPEELDKIAWHRENSNIRRQPTGRLRPNNFGIFDCLGNANEWILTRTIDSPSRSKSYMGFAFCDSPAIYTFRPTHRPAETANRGYPTVGFRVICALSND